MSVSNKKKKAILKGYPSKSVSELSRELGISEKEVKAVLKEAGRFKPKAGWKALALGLAALALAALVAAGVHFIRAPGPARLARLQGRLNLLLVTIDTCRADRLGCYGYAPALTPVIDGLAKKGVMFTQVYSAAPITLPSHTTILTGTHPAFHGVMDNGLFSLPDKAVTLAEVLKEAGFATAAVIASYVLDGRFGLKQGFDFYDDSLLRGRREDSAGFDEIPANSVSDQALSWLARHREERWFLWIHYYDPHADYVPPPEFRNRAASAYDGEIAFVDYELGRVIDFLRTNQLISRTLIAITADHGESLGEHGELTHSLFLYEAPMRVPLILSLPRALPSGRKIAEPVSLMDLAPTLLDALGIPPPETVQGKSLLPWVFGKQTAPPHPAVLMETMAPWFQHGWSPSYGVISGDYKFINAPKPELYNLKADPREEHNLYREEKGRAEAMKRLLLRERERLGRTSLLGQTRKAINEETRERLKSLGYVFTGSASMTPSPDAPDVKDMIWTMKESSRANTLYKAGRVQEAVEVLEGILEKDPRNRRLLNRIGVWLGKAGKYEAAEFYLKKLISLAPDFTEGYLNLGNVYVNEGRYREAQAMAQTLIELDPASAKARNLLGLIAFRQGDYETAAARFKEAVKLRPFFHEGWANLGASYYHLGRKKDALAAYENALKIMPGNPDYRSKVERLKRE